MAQERRYTEAEIEEIFDLAARAGEARVPALRGGFEPTLRDLQEIGREAGISPQYIAEAAQRVDARHEIMPRRRSLGMPVSVGRTATLPRELTDREWELLVAELRDTFGAAGQVSAQGGAREWSNGNLRVLLEPAESGQRLRMSTLNGRRLVLNQVCLVDVVVGLVFVVHALLQMTGLQPALQVLPSVILATPGVVGLAWSRLNLPKWASKRESQMEHVAERARALAGPGAPDVPDA